MRICLLLVVLAWTQSVVAATFVGPVTGRFVVTEYLDGTSTTAAKPGTLELVLTTDYSQIDWELTFDVDLLMTGSPSQPFETRFSAQGTINTDGPSPLAFPDENGTAKAGLYTFTGGSAEWTFTKRIVTSQTVYDSGPKAVTHDQAYVYKTNSLQVLNYPTNVTLYTNMYSEQFNLGHISLGPNHWIEAKILYPSASQWPSSVVMQELMPGDFSGEASVNAADYVVWRKATGPVAPFLASYDVWCANFGKSSGAGGGSSSTVPEPSSLVLIVAAGMILTGRRFRT